jgi:hypothetical protein
MINTHSYIFSSASYFALHIKENRMSESKFKREFKEDIGKRLPEVEIFEPNATTKRSSPDMIMLGEAGWAALEFKRSKNADHQPNQDYRVFQLNEKGYATFVYPENKEEVLHDLEELFSS